MTTAMTAAMTTAATRAPARFPLTPLPSSGDVSGAPTKGRGRTGYARRP
jgi:hypothetical protein